MLASEYYIVSGDQQYAQKHQHNSIFYLKQKPKGDGYTSEMDT